jgi:hypothetical protein
MAVIASPQLIKDIQGRALSWTPSSAEPLNNGGVYVWYVKATDAYGTTKCSHGNIFKVEIFDRYLKIGEKLSEVLKEKGLSDELIGDVLREIASEDESESGKTVSKNSGYNTQDKIGIQGNEVGSNTWYGENAGTSLTTGYSNTFMGLNAGYNTTTGYHNTFVGRSAGRANIIGYGNTFIGTHAGELNTGNDNTFIGKDAGLFNNSGHDNTFIGKEAGHHNLSGNYNTFIGQEAGYWNVADYNTFIGQFSGVNNSSGNSNTFLGQSAGAANKWGDANTFIGRSAGVQTTTGYYNTFIGRAAGAANKTGYGNIFLGYYAGYFETGSNKLYISNSNTSSPLIYGEFDNEFVTINGTLNANDTNVKGVLDVNNDVIINGKLGVGTSSPNFSLEVETTRKDAIFGVDRTDGARTVLASRSNMGALGTLTNHPLVLATNASWRMRINTDDSLSMSNGASCTVAGVWTDASSRAYKENIHDLTIIEAKDALSELNPVKYNYKKDKDEDYLGFIAEDVPELVASKDRKGMSPMDVVAVLTKVAQEQQKTISELQKRITGLEKRTKTDK